MSARVLTPRETAAMLRADGYPAGSIAVLVPEPVHACLQPPIGFLSLRRPRLSMAPWLSRDVLGVTTGPGASTAVVAIWRDA